MASPRCWKEHLIRLSGTWIDGDDPSAEAPVAPAGNEPVAEEYLADLLLVDSLLANMSRGADEEREKRIREVMRAIDASASAPLARARVLRWSSLLALAAALLIVVVGSWIQFSRRSLASEVLLAVNEVSSAATDRVYTFRRVRSSSDRSDAPQGRLYLRGRSGFVVICDEAILGRNADQFWVVVPPREVILSTDFQWIEARWTRDELGLRFVQELSLESRHIPLMQLASVGELMRHDYDVTLGRGQLAHRAMDVLTGHRRSTRTERPAIIRLWADSSSRIVVRAELEWERDNALILELAPAEPLTEDWYSYRAHCQGEPTVRRIPQRP